MDRRQGAAWALAAAVIQAPLLVWCWRRERRAARDRARLVSEAVVAADRERRRIARDLHDGVIQDLAGAGYALDALVSEFPEPVDEPVEHIIDLAQRAIRRSTQALRTLIVEVTPPDLDSGGLADAVRDLADRFAVDSGVAVTASIDLPRAMPGEVAAAAYRAVRECLRNIAAHAHARRVHLTVRSGAQEVYVSAEDDGRGFPDDLDERRRAGHVGLSLLAAAVDDLGGRVDIGRGATTGSIVTCRIPLDTRPAGRSGRQPRLRSR